MRQFNYLHEAHDLITQAIADQDVNALERISGEIQGLMMPQNERDSYVEMISAITGLVYDQIAAQEY